MDNAPHLFERGKMLESLDFTITDYQLKEALRFRLKEQAP